MEDSSLMETFSLSDSGHVAPGESTSIDEELFGKIKLRSTKAGLAPVVLPLSKDCSGTSLSAHGIALNAWVTHGEPRSLHALSVPLAFLQGKIL